MGFGARSAELPARGRDPEKDQNYLLIRAVLGPSSVCPFCTRKTHKRLLLLARHVAKLIATSERRSIDRSHAVPVAPDSKIKVPNQIYLPSPPTEKNKKGRIYSALIPFTADAPRLVVATGKGIASSRWSAPGTAGAAFLAEILVPLVAVRSGSTRARCRAGPLCFLTSFTLLTRSVRAPRQHSASEKYP